MDDDIRDRFRRDQSGRTPESLSRPLLPRRPAPPAPRPAPLSRPAVPPPAPAPPINKLAPATPVKNTSSPRTRKRKGKKWLVVILLLVILIGLGAAGYVLYKKYLKKPTPAKSATATSSTQTASAAKPTGTIRFIATGDNLAFDSINTAALQPDGSYNYLPMMANFKPFFDKADIKLCNETTPAGGDKNGLAISGYPTFNAPLAWSTGLAGLGCNLIDLASNHTSDKGQPAIDTMVDTWNSQSNILAFAGANKSADDQAKIHYFSVKGVKFAYLAYTTSSAIKPDNPYSVSVYSDDLANQQIAEAHKNADLILVSINWGTENSGDITPDQDRIAQNLATQNVDVVIGSGPHVLQPAKILSGKDGHQTLVWYSLGNFLNSELPIENLVGGMAVMDFDAATQHITNPELIPVYMHYEWTAAQKAAGTINARHNFMLYPLDQAADPLARSQNNTTVQAQTDRVTSIITKFVPIKVIKSTDF